MNVDKYNGVRTGGSMDRTSGNNEGLEGTNKPTDAVALSARRQWVKPVLERLSLKDALTADGDGPDGPNGS
jgi:hypothetical protein